jgi:thiol-disulfide isomerase/thioredoxin
MKKLITTLLLLTAATSLWAQPVISVQVPDFAGKNMVFSLKKGLKSDTIFNDKLDAAGLATFRLPTTDQNFSGMATLSFSPQEGMDLIVNRTSFVVSIMTKDFAPENIAFANSDENTAFLAWTQARRSHDQKAFALSQITTLYSPEDAFYTALSKETERLNESKPVMQAGKDTDWYAPDFVRLVDCLSGSLAQYARSNEGLNETIAVRNDFLALDIESLYTSGLWFNIINAALTIYQPEATASFHNSFGSDVSSILKRTASQEVYEAFASDILMICQQFGWDRAQDEIVLFLVNDNRIKDTNNARLKSLLSMVSTMPGKIAPPITGIDRFSDGEHEVLLLFYESGCESCATVIKDLKENIDFFNEKQVRIISVAADKDQKQYAEYSASFPWQDRVVDYKGFSGGNFKPYGVMATPTLFLLNQNDQIINRYSNIKEVMERLEQ